MGLFIQGKIQTETLPLEVYDAGMLDCWILINGADDGIARDFPAYRDAHRQLLHDYIARFVVHGGLNATQ